MQRVLNNCPSLFRPPRIGGSKLVEMYSGNGPEKAYCLGMILKSEKTQLLLWSLELLELYSGDGLERLGCW